MRRLLQFSTLLLMVTVVAAPISEAMDRWDPPGLGHDTEFKLVCLAICLALVVLVSQLLAMSQQVISLVAALVAPAIADDRVLSVARRSVPASAAAYSPPLQI